MTGAKIRVIGRDVSASMLQGTAWNARKRSRITSRRSVQIFQIASALSNDAYVLHVNLQWARILDLLEMNVQYEHCSGLELNTRHGRTVTQIRGTTLWS